MSIPESPLEGNSATVSYGPDGHILHRSLFRRIFPTLLIILIALVAFGSGRLSVLRQGGGGGAGVVISYDKDFVKDATTVFGTSTPSVSQATPAPASESNTNSSSVFASSKGSKYYYAGCKNTISTKNKVTFASPNIAEAAGYTLASNCHK